MFLPLLLNRFSMVGLSVAIFSSPNFAMTESGEILSSEFVRAGEMKTAESGNPHIFTLELHQDDPAKCTSAKMRKLGFARAVVPNRISKEAIILNPFAETTLLKSDGDNALQHGLVVIDCSWVKATRVFKKKVQRSSQKVPALIAGNPTNYAKLVEPELRRSSGRLSLHNELLRCCQQTLEYLQVGGYFSVAQSRCT